jgi:hypothetical protein
MSLVIKSEENPRGRKKSTFSFREWYEKHKNELAKKKKIRYETDSAYRAAIIARSAAAREKKKKEKENASSGSSV